MSSRASSNRILAENSSIQVSNYNKSLQTLQDDLVLSKINILVLNSNSTFLTRFFLAVVFFAFSFNVEFFVFNDDICVGRVCFDFDTFQISDTGLKMRQ